MGLVAGAAGKTALDLSTYLDMLLRGRPASEVPARVASRVTRAAVRTADDLIEAAPADVEDALEDALEPTAQELEAGADRGRDEGPGPRVSATGALSGVAIGLGLGAVYAMLRQRRASLPGWATILSGTALGAAAMAASDVPAVVTGATSHPREWTTTAWLSDIVPHAIYGIVTVATFEAIRSEGSPFEGLAAVVRR